MLNLFEHFDQSSADFLRSQLIAKMKVPTVVMHDNGYLPPEVDSPIQFFCDLKPSNHPACYFDQVKVPPYWRITADAGSGKIWDLKTQRGEIRFIRNDNKRFVKEVCWFDDEQKPCWIDHYDQFGRIFAKTYYAQGKARVTKCFDRHGNTVIVHNMVAGDVFLNYQGKKRHFINYAQFIVYYLRLHHYKLDHILYNTLNEALGVSLALPNDEGCADALLWHETLGDQLPGNMQYLLDHDTRTKKIIFQDYRQWQSKQALLKNSPNVEFSYLGMIYPHPRGNSLQPQTLTITNSDQLDGFEELVKLSPNITFNVAAVTPMSSRLMNMKKYQNVRLYPMVRQDQLQHLLKNCDVYLDINQGIEILDAVRGAFEQNMLITGFANTVHEPKFVAMTNVFQPGDMVGMAKQIAGALVSPQRMGALVDEQRKEASDMWPKDYVAAFGKWVH